MGNEFTILNAANEAIRPIRHEENIPDTPLLRFAERYTAAGDYGRMDFQELKLRNLTIWFSHYRMDGPAVVRARTEKAVTEAHVMLENQMAQSPGGTTLIPLDRGEFNITYTPCTENKARFGGAGLYTTFDLHPDIGFLQSLVTDFPLLDPFLNQVHKGSGHPVSFLKNRSFLSPDMRVLINKIIQHQSGPEATLSFTEVLSIELLLLFLLRSRLPLNPRLRQYNRHTEAMLYIRDILKTQADENDFEDLYYTEAQLADKVGISVYQLKTAFKMAFGMGPYKMLMDFRFLKARRLLLDTSLSVIDIALKTGYQSRESFIKAYTRRFGISPARYRKNY